MKVTNQTDEFGPDQSFGFEFETNDPIPVSASRDQASSQVSLSNQEIVEFTLEDGSVWYANPENVKELYRLAGEKVNTSQRGTTKFDTYPNLFDSQPSRGNSDLRVRSIVTGSIADSVEEQLKDLLKGKIEEEIAKFGSAVIDRTSFLLARMIEKRVSDLDGESQVCRVRFKDNDIELTPSEDPLPLIQQPWLLLIHGTFSSTKKAFGQIWKSCPNSYSKLRNEYADRTIALEHCTLTESPIQNALAILEQLPANAKLHILTHSRGGLVGEILCRSGRANTAFTESELRLYENEIMRASGEAFESKFKAHLKDELDRLRRINELLNSKKIKVERFVMVGCPARGTSLASDKLHLWANRLLNVVGLIPAASMPVPVKLVLKAIKAFILGTIKNSTDPLTLPGLAAQMPEGALVKVLNSREEATHADLSPITCSYEARGWKRIPVWFVDQFYGGDHDFVVNTNSMDGGTKRAKPISVFHVNDNRTHHLNYFSNKFIVGQIVEQLTSKSGAKSFEKAGAQRHRGWFSKQRPSAKFGKAPNLIVLPGIMGTELSQNSDRIWVNYFRLAMGGFDRLKIDAQGVTPDQAYPNYYAAFMKRFSSSHFVVPFPYDWRLSLTSSAARLAERLNDLLNRMRDQRVRQPIRIVAHSMGGLVVSLLAKKEPELWKRVMSHPDSRFIMAGTPFKGSYAIPRSFVGHESVVRSLALLDLTKSLDDFKRELRQFPGMMDMMPDFGQLKWLNESETWKKLNSKESLKWNDADSANIKLSRKTRDDLNKVKFDHKKTIYVAGQSHETPCDAIIKNGRVQFKKTKQGDGQVTWESGIPESVNKIYYQPTAHGELLNASEHFDAWQQIIEKGTTNLLNETPPVRSWSRDQTFDTQTEQQEIMGPDVVDILPSETHLFSQALGNRATKDPNHFNPNQSRLEIFVTHGDLKFASYPVLVGHYTDDSIVHAERALDQFLDEKLTLRHKTGDYPGPIGTNEIVLLHRHDLNRFPDGAIVVGIGLFGELTASKLQRTISSGLVKYALEINELPPENIPPELGVSVLLVGSGQAGIAVHDCVYAIINAVNDANRRLTAVNNASLRLITKVEIIDYWEDVALTAADALTNATKDQQYAHIDFDEKVRQRPGRLRRTHTKVNSSWFHNIRINSKKGNDGNEVLVFSDFNRRARSERETEVIKTEFVDQFVDAIMYKSQFANPDINAHKTLFEMLLPNRIKDNSPDSDRIRFIVDPKAARFPWEMLVDGWSQQGTPLAYNKRIIRQLETPTFRERPQPATGNKVLIVGDPPGGKNFPQLKGAREEAISVANIFKEFGSYEVKSIISPADRKKADPETPVRILNSLLSEENFILHFAAHGTYSTRRDSDFSSGDTSCKHKHDGDCCKCSESSKGCNKYQEHKYSNAEGGMVIGPGRFLTPSDVQNIRRVPTLVFLNCCHLGLIKEEKERHVDFIHIATNLATQFIEMGTKLVIAAAWSVDDSAAKTFAEEFYSRFLGNETFADAVYYARRKTYNLHGNVNTFGAYQAWGDHEFKLRKRNRNSSTSDTKKYASSSVCITEANNIRYKAKSNPWQEMGWLCEEANCLLKYLLNTHEGNGANKKPWDRPAIRALVGLGRAFGEIGAFRSAIVLIEKAHDKNASALTLRDLEQLANFKVRLAVELEAGQSKFLGYDAKSWMDEGINELYLIIGTPGFNESSENFQPLQALLASAIRRKATMLDPKTDYKLIRECLQQVFLHYSAAWLKKDNNGTSFDEVIEEGIENNRKPDRYYFCSLVLADVMDDLFAQSQDYKFGSEFFGLINEFMKESGNKNRPAEFWDAVARTHIHLIQMLHPEIRRKTRGLTRNSRLTVNKQIEEIEEVYQDIKDLFNEVNRLDIGSVRQWLSLFDEVFFVRCMLQKLQIKKGNTKSYQSRKKVDEFVILKLAELESDLRRFSGKDIVLAELSEEKLDALYPYAGQ